MKILETLATIALFTSLLCAQAPPAAPSGPPSPGPTEVQLTDAERAREENFKAALDNLKVRFQVLQTDHAQFVQMAMHDHALDASKYRYNEQAMEFVKMEKPPTPPPAAVAPVKPEAKPAPASSTKK